jgi:hypothetical protein
MLNANFYENLPFVHIAAETPSCVVKIPLTHKILLHILPPMKIVKKIVFVD